MPKKTEAAAAGAPPDIQPTAERKATLLAELAEIEAAEKKAAIVEYPKALYKDGNVRDVVTVESAGEEAARVAEGYGDLAPVKA